jgi:hypothetical protein
VPSGISPEIADLDAWRKIIVMRHFVFRHEYGLGREGSS